MARRRCCQQKALQGEERRHADVLEFLRRARSKGLRRAMAHGGRGEEALAPQDPWPWSVTSSMAAGRQRNRRCSTASLPPRAKPRKSWRDRRTSGNGSRRVSGQADEPRSTFIGSATSKAFRAGPSAGSCRARTLYRVLAEIGGTDLVGPARELDPGTFYTSRAERIEFGAAGWLARADACGLVCRLGVRGSAAVAGAASRRVSPWSRSAFRRACL